MLENLNKRERYHQDIYDAIGNNGLNLCLVKNEFKIYVISEETKSKLIYARSRQIISNENKIKFAKCRLGHTSSQSHKNKISVGGKNRKNIGSGRSKIVLNLQTGIFYSNAMSGAIAHGVNCKTIYDYLNGVYPNRTDLIYI